jgi:ubiquinone/menaquinone biosynthesis C-methylase UbiE
MTDHFAEIYQKKADQYERMVSREDYQNHIYSAIQGVRDLSGLDVIDSGTGTGRLACMFAPIARSMAGFDTSEAMLAVANQRLKDSGIANWRTGLADHRKLPAEDASADVILSGWSVVYTVVWCADRWQNELSRALAEMQRVLRPGGTLIILETMGTGFETPKPPPDLLDYFRYLEEQGFSSTWFRTDYKFASLEEARQLTTFFFGEGIVEKIQQAGDAAILPECTGMWWKKF